MRGKLQSIVKLYWTYAVLRQSLLLVRLESAFGTLKGESSGRMAAAGFEPVPILNADAANHSGKAATTRGL
jgi:hypothetical protein